MSPKLSRYESERRSAERVKNGYAKLTYDDCLKAISYSVSYIEYVPLHFKTEELCKKAVARSWNHTNIIKYIPQHILSEAFLTEAIGVDAYNIRFIPKELLTFSLVVSALKKSPKLLQYIPEDFIAEVSLISIIAACPRVVREINDISPELLRDIIKNAPKAVKYIENFSSITPKELESILELDWQLIKYLPRRKVTKRICDIAFNCNWRTFPFLPNRFKDQERCNLATSKDPKMIEYCPKDFISYEMCKRCVNKDGALLEFVPDEFKTDELCLVAIKKHPELVSIIPQCGSDPAFLSRCLNENILCFKYVDKKLINSYCLIQVIQQYNNHFLGNKSQNPTQNLPTLAAKIKEVAEYLRETKGLDYDIIKEERLSNFRAINSSYYDAESGVFVVNESYYTKDCRHSFSDFESFYRFMCGNLLKSDLTEYDFPHLEYEHYCINGAYLPSWVLIKKDIYDPTFYNNTICTIKDPTALTLIGNESKDVCLVQEHNLTSNTLNASYYKLYYISDIHITHKLQERFPVNASYDEIRLFIRKYITKMLSSAPCRTNMDYLLVGGDVTCCFPIAELFYKELALQWTPSKIIAVLGNHELWHFNINGQSLENVSVQDVVDLYKKMASSLHINFLHNELYIEKSNSYFPENPAYTVSEILTEEQLAKMTCEEIKAKVINSRLSILGGIGFSGYNLGFNAFHGLYRNTIKTLEEDVKHTKRFEGIYNHLRNSIPLERLVVLTHTQRENWTTLHPIPNWIYVNGHTHRNTFAQTDECTIFSDNQIGYTSKSAHLKHFTLDSSYNPLKYYDDGMHYISPEEYLSFNHGIGIRPTFAHDIYSILMLKRMGLYLFLALNKTNGRIYILNGGQVRKLANQNPNYYFENMGKYVEFIKLGMSRFNDALKHISSIIKSIGGQGSVHGCIVDIDFYHHIYLDPFDGNITAYYSPIFGTRRYFSSTEELLKKSLPHLHQNYVKLLEGRKSIIPHNLEDVRVDSEMMSNKEFYAPSRLIKQLQYVTENNVIRVWKDEFIENYDAYLSGEKTFLPE